MTDLTPRVAKESIRILIAASGTGGHLIPALLIAQEFKRCGVQVEISFVGSGRPLEDKLIGGAGYNRYTVPIVGLKRRGIRGALEFSAKLPGAILATLRILREFKPDLVIGVGGYASFFPVALASLSGTPTWIHEAELRPGLTNLALSLFARRISLSIPGTKLPFWAKGIYTGHPVKPDVVAVGAEQWSGEPPRKLLVMGGSQGAQSIDTALLEMVPWIREHNLSVFHQARGESVQTLASAYSRAGIDAQVVPFIDQVATAYRWSDLIVARSGAGTVMEIGAVGRPAILVPLPTAAGNEQEANARLLVESGKGVIVKEGERFAERLRDEIGRMLDLGRYREMRLANGLAREVNGSTNIVNGALELVGVKRRAP